MDLIKKEEEEGWGKGEKRGADYRERGGEAKE